jgi:hypothetical protein
MQKALLERRILACVCREQPGARMLPFTTTPQVGQKRTVTTARP